MGLPQSYEKIFTIKIISELFYIKMDKNKKNITFLIPSDKKI